MTGIIFLFVVVFAFWFFKRNAKKTMPSEEDSYNAREEGNKAIKEYRKKWSGIGFHSATDEQFELISNMENIYKPPESQDFDSYIDPTVNEDQIIEFIHWARNKQSINQKSSLLEIFSDELEIFTPEISIDFDMEIQDDGGFFCEGFNEYGFCITRFKHSCIIDFSIEDWVKILSEPSLFDWIHLSDWDDEDLWAYNYNEGDVTHYLKENNAEFIPPNKDIDDYWDYEAQGNMYELVKIQPVKDISFKGEIFTINDKEFSFLKKEKDYLVILLMASYKSYYLNLIVANKDN